MSDFLLQIVDKKTGEVHLWWEPRERTDLDLAEAICKGLEARGVGVFVTQATVLQAVREVLPVAVLDLKKRVRPTARKP